MENLNNQNLISDGYNPENTESLNSASETGIETVQKEAPAENTPADAKVEPSETNQPNDFQSEHSELLRQLLDHTLDRFADRLREAEEKGFRNAVEIARKNPAELGIDTSAPNFLVDMRGDCWND